MAHRAKHLRRNWIAERVVSRQLAAGPATTAATTGLSGAIRGRAQQHRVLSSRSFMAQPDFPAQLRRDNLKHKRARAAR